MQNSASFQPSANGSSTNGQADRSSIEQTVAPSSLRIPRSRDPQISGSQISGSPTANAESSEGGGLGNILGIVKRHSLLVASIAALYFGYAARSVVNQSTQYTGEFQLLVQPVNAENASLATPSADGQARRAPKLDYATQIAILKSPGLLQDVADDLQETYPNLTGDALSNQINIQRLNKTKLLQVTYQSNDASKTAAILDALSEKYLRYSLSERQTNLRQGLAFVNDQIGTLSSQLSELQNRLEKFQRQNNFLDPATQTDQITEQVAGLLQKQQTLDQEIVDVQSQASVLQEEEGARVAIANDIEYKEINVQIQNIDAQIAIELSRFRPENPAIQNLERQRQNLEQLLNERAQEVLSELISEANVQIKTRQIQLNAVNSKKAVLEEQLTSAPALSREYASLNNEIQITNESLTEFLGTRQTLQVEAAQQELPWELVKEPKISSMEPSVAKDLITTLAIGLALGGGAAFLLDKLDNTYHTVDSIKNKVKLPLLGVLPFNSELTQAQRSSPLGFASLNFPSLNFSSLNLSSLNFAPLNAASFFQEDNGSVKFTEALRVIQSNIQTSHASQTKKVFAVSSAASGDGKSTLALHWAKTAAKMGQRVLLIDSVLHAPSLHQALGLANQVGLSNLLTQDITQAKGIERVYADQELYAITSGTPVSDPTSLLSSPKMGPLLSSCKQVFDLIIIDTPPLLGLADARIINRQTDGLVLVVRLDKTDKAYLQEAIDYLHEADAAVLGLVVNGYKGRSTVTRVTNKPSSNPEAEEEMLLEGTLPVISIAEDEAAEPESNGAGREIKEEAIASKDK